MGDGVTALTGALLLGGTALHGMYYRNSPVFGRVLTRLPDPNTVALTFDDGPNAGATPRILDTLAEHGVRATFFVLGRAAEVQRELVRRIVAEGHQVGNHGATHRKLSWVTPRTVQQEIRAGTASIREAAGVSPAFFRAPHGFRNPWVASAARAEGQRTVGWSLGVWDSDAPPGDVITRRVLTGVRPGAIILLHDGDGYDPGGDRMRTADALPGIIRGLRERGYAFAPLPAT